ncbi:hypothetical protein KH5H1_18470 [Corallococcus caeni]|nr:hypothetical protein KH5H1_18470 [Corallococcus sp. KH5-1]
MLFNERSRLTAQKALLEQDREVAGEAHHTVIQIPPVVEVPQAFWGKLCALKLFEESNELSPNPSGIWHERQRGLMAVLRRSHVLKMFLQLLDESHGLASFHQARVLAHG